MDLLRAQLDEARCKGNEAFKAGNDALALRIYSKGLDKARQAGVVDLNADVRSNSVLQLVATLYANRAAAGLKVLRYEQVIYDASTAATLLLTKGCSEADLRLAPDVKAIYGKARVRRAAAFEALGNFMAAHHDYLEGGKQSDDHVAQRRAWLLCEALNFPVRYGAVIYGLSPPGQTVPPAPPSRSSANVDGAVVKRLKCRLPAACIFMGCCAWQGRIYIWGGGIANPLRSEPRDELVVLDFKKETVNIVDLKHDPNSQRQYGLPGVPTPRHRHSMVLWRDSLFVFGGQFELGDVTDETDGRTVWRLDLSAQPLTWQRIYCRGTCPPARKNHTAVVWQDQMVVFGGEAQRWGAELGDVWSLDLLHNSWRNLAPSPPPRELGAQPTAPEPRREHSCWVHGDWLYVFGGMSNSAVRGGAQGGAFTMNAFTFPSMWRFSLTQQRWEQVFYSGNFPCPRGEMAVAVSPRGVVYLAGGYSTAASTAVHGPGASGPASILMSAYSGELFEFCCQRQYFRRVLDPDRQPALGGLRAAASACWVDGQMLVLGGYSALSAEAVSQQTVVSIDLRVCAHCGTTKHGAKDQKLSQCSKCKEERRPPVHYCSPECMSQDWPTHKVVCSGKGILQ